MLSILRGTVGLRSATRVALLVASALLIVACDVGGATGGLESPAVTPPEEPDEDAGAPDAEPPAEDEGDDAEAPAAEPPGSPAPDGSLVWSDEFDGTALDTDVWEPYHSTYGDGNNELQCHTPSNVKVSDGTAKITARRGEVTCPGGEVRQYSSAFLGTRETGTYFPTYGRFEIRARVPHGQGLWPAFWLRHRNGSSTAEIDVMEYFHSQVPGSSTSTLHLDGQYNVSKKTAFFEQPTANPGWHTWAVDIAEAGDGVKFTFLLDGTTIHSFTDTQHRWARDAGEQLWDIAVNLSVGGDWVGSPDGPLGLLSNNRCAQDGTPQGGCKASTSIRRAQFPSTYEVDYVRVYSD